MKTRAWVCGLLAVLGCIALLAGCVAEQPTSSDKPATSTTGSTSAQTQSTKAPAPSTTESTAPTAGTTGTTAPSAPETSSRDKIEELAKSLLGTPFKMGATGPESFDNSGFVYYCFNKSGVKLPRFTEEMYAAGSAVEKSDLQPGDVVFFYNETPGSVDFAGIYIGNGEFVACNNENSPTKIHKLAWPYFADRYLGARRY